MAWKKRESESLALRQIQWILAPAASRQHFYYAFKFYSPPSHSPLKEIDNFSSQSLCVYDLNSNFVCFELFLNKTIPSGRLSKRLHYTSSERENRTFFFINRVLLVNLKNCRNLFARKFFALETTKSRAKTRRNSSRAFFFVGVSFRTWSWVDFSLVCWVLKKVIPVAFSTGKRLFAATSLVCYSRRCRSLIKQYSFL